MGIKIPEANVGPPVIGLRTENIFQRLTVVSSVLPDLDKGTKAFKQKCIIKVSHSEIAPFIKIFRDFYGRK